MPRSRSKMLRMAPKSPPTTPPQAARGTHLLVDPDAGVQRRTTTGRLDMNNPNARPPAPMWSGPNSKNPDAFMLDASASSFASDKGTAGDSTCPDLGTCNVDAANKANASTARGHAQADEPPVIVTSPLPDLKKDNGEPIKPYASRFIRIEAVALAHFDKGKPMDVLSSMPGFHEQVSKLGVFEVKPTPVDTLSTIYMFSDTVSLAREMFSFLKKHYNVTYTTLEGFAKAKVYIPDHVTRMSGTVTVVATVKNESVKHKFNPEQIGDMVMGVVARFGKIEDFGTVDEDLETCKFSLEYDSVNDANDAILNTRPGDDMIFGRHEHLYVSVDNDEFVSEASSPVTPGEHQDHLTYSRTGRTAWGETPSGRTMTFSGYVSTPSTSRGHRRDESHDLGYDYIYQAADTLAGMEAYALNEKTGLMEVVSHKPQDVIESRIRDGLDVRTTLMIRNVPPEFTAADLYAIVHQCAPGQFDFAYNRIDFRQNQAVGYAFVNFTSTQALLAFVEFWRGRLLPRNVHRRHAKPCDVSYANIQGVDCLISKFRNSSILDEASDCRPKLFWVAETAPSEDLIGKEREFPGVDNQAKKNRSLQNAHVTGLYTPRTRTNGRGRGRRGGVSQFDRGTSAQQYDERQMNLNFPFQNNGFNGGFNGGYNGGYNGGFNGGFQGGFNNGMPHMPPYGHFSQPRFHPGVQYGHWGPEFSSPTHAAQSSMLRTHTNGQLGPHLQVMPAYMAPVHNAGQVYLHHQGDFAPLLPPVKGQPARNFRRVQ